MAQKTTQKVALATYFKEKKQMDQKRALSRIQFARSDFKTEDYMFADKEGEFIATLNFKRWDKKCNLLAYITFESGENVLCNAWKNNDYLGLSEIPIGSKIRVTFTVNSKGKINLVKVEMIA